MAFESTPNIALIEDDDIVRQATSQWLQLAGFNVEAFSTGDAGKAAILSQDFDAVVSDVRLPDSDGLSILESLIEHHIQTPVILITGHGDVDMAVSALQKGAFDFIEKPFQPERLSQRVTEAVETYRAQTSTQDRQEYLASVSGLEEVLIGRSRVMQQLREQVAKLARIDTNVIIYGETGCGKELVATSLHKESQRKSHRFVPINCGAIPENLFESELFGHEPGAFTGASKRRIGKLEYADKGTLFFDEIESMPLSMQVKVLRSLQEHTVERVGGNQQINVDLRVIAAAKEDLNDHEEFRQDLYYRLNVAQIYLPPLREREEDALILFEHFALQTNSDSRPLSDADRNAVLSYAWPGNVRELRNVAMRFALDDTVSVMEILSSRPSSTTEETQAGVPLMIQLHNFERKVLHDSLVRHQGRINEVMQELDLPRRTLNQKMQKFGLNRSDYTDS
ncbi:TPA: sigma-54-dependent Fis family transcriptional regulator [Vibrio parahaemolyticus]|uniref:sigma-54-dependent transcriptional regulator n=1 Tax=Vibrio parahaemolyticus TaxID=670 RepID=UPI0009429C1B|nr:sigma-54 dependent transcriptional regulator [Vibrio parahaemolyticus]MBE3890891.1 sigma-54-dependent Fis family transcriptional regulator [Vibrio parahaemolyticus]MBE3992766.1 sigma-54-dependent Fis family transcriptional regulator [Vibrio parahaemolyticus]OKY32021.1 DNA-binding response regulator [Vibrio parahaemolyticus]HCG6386003.1 sigma-54-dependent Fis family transcriptional regulator [Vibrio parahaemolyticus]HCG8249833.1 sigma-54-dependent Fis family transcriptional regulator [Vibrio